MPTYVPFNEGLETPPEAEAKTIADIIATMKTEMDKVADREHHMTRASHAKSTGLLKGTLTIPPGLPQELALGLFATPATYEAVIRFAQGPGEHLSDSVSTHRGMAVKLFGVSGDTLPGNPGAVHDFVFATGTTFPQGDAAAFLTAIRGIEKGTGMPEFVKQAVSSTMRAANAVVQAVGGDSPTFGFFGHTKRNPLADAYFSQAPVRFGSYVAKLGFFPVSPELLTLLDQTVDTSQNPDAFRAALVEHMRVQGADYELRAQLCIDLESMPVENASVPWPEKDSSYRVVARLSIPAQDAYSPARQTYFDERLSFRPAHSLSAHRPLGSIMRARLATYQKLADARHMAEGDSEAAPETIEAVPD